MANTLALVGLDRLEETFPVLSQWADEVGSFWLFWVLPLFAGC